MTPYKQSTPAASASHTLGVESPLVTNPGDPGAHMSIFEKTENRLHQLRNECESLRRYFADSETETAAHMMAGLDMFTSGFLKLTKLIENQSGKEIMEDKVLYIE